MSERRPTTPRPFRSASGWRIRRPSAICFATAWRWSRRPRAYLDGPGRQESKKLDRTAALAYATESMRLTTRLMQLASWLLLHRAVKEGEMSLAQANKEKAKVKLTAADNDDNNYKVLPERLRHLIDRSRHLQSAIRRLDATMHARPDPARIRPRQSGRAPARPAQGRVRAGIAVRADRHRPKQKPRSRGALTFRHCAGSLLLEARGPRTSSGSARAGRRGRAAAAGRRSRPDATSGRCRGAACRPPCPRWCGW